MPAPAVCPSETDLLLVALGHGERDSSAETSAHVAGCARCSSTVADLRSVATAVRRAERAEVRPRSPCVDALAVAAFVDGRAEGGERATIIEHLVECRACRSQVAEVSAALHDPAIAGELRPAAPGAGEKWQRWRARGTAFVGVAAVLLLFVMLREPLTDDPASAAFRDDPATAGATPRIIGPLESAAASTRFVWTSVIGANQYRVTVFAMDGRVVWETQTADTVVTPPSPSPLVSGERYLWQVAAQTDFDRWSNSALTELRVVPGSGR
jgi:anti-sigma factor RsiW